MSGRDPERKAFDKKNKSDTSRKSKLEKSSSSTKTVANGTGELYSKKYSNVS